MKKTTCWAVLVYGAAMVLLGLAGFFFGGSSVSLIAGAGFGVLLLLSARQMFSHKKSGLYAATAFTLLLTATFSVRYTVTQKPIPAILAVLSGGMLLFLLAQIGKWKRDS